MTLGVLISSHSFSVYAAPWSPIVSGAELSSYGDGVAEWSSETHYRGMYSIHLAAPGKATWNGTINAGEGVNEGRIVIELDPGTTLGDIESLSWWVNTTAGYPPHADLLLDIDGDGVFDYKDQCPHTRAGAKVNADGCEIVANTVIEDGFDFDSAMLKPAMKATLDKVAEGVNNTPATEQLTVVGHTDSIGTEAYNQALSERRAHAVAGYLAGKGVSKSDMTVSGAGESQPVASNMEEAGRSKNRRVEITTK